MQRSPLLLLLCCCLTATQANRVYIHPFSLFASANVICETLQTKPSKPLETVPVTPLDTEVLTPDIRDQSELEAQRQNITQRTAVLAELLNALGLRMYKHLSSKEQSTNTLLSPVNTFGSLVTFYLGASKKTASSFQVISLTIDGVPEGFRKSRPCWRFPFLSEVMTDDWWLTFRSSALTKKKPTFLTPFSIFAGSSGPEQRNWPRRLRVLGGRTQGSQDPAEHQLSGGRWTQGWNHYAGLGLHSSGRPAVRRLCSGNAGLLRHIVHPQPGLLRTSGRQ